MLSITIFKSNLEQEKNWIYLQSISPASDEKIYENERKKSQRSEGTCVETIFLLY